MSKFVQLLNQVQKTLMFTENSESDPFNLAVADLPPEHQPFVKAFIAAKNTDKETPLDKMSSEQQGIVNSYYKALAERLKNTASTTSLEKPETKAQANTNQPPEQTNQTPKTDTTSSSSFIPAGLDK